MPSCLSLSLRVFPFSWTYMRSEVSRHTMATISLSATSVERPFTSHVVSRSNELLSCAKTAVKIARSQQVESLSTTTTWWNVNLSDIRLCNQQAVHHTNALLEEGLALLRTMDSELNHLENLVKRRGHTNDPTEEIAVSVKQLESDMQELMDLVRNIVPKGVSSKQRRKHWEMVQKWFQGMAGYQGVRLKEVLIVRGKVVAEQAERRKQFQAASKSKRTVSNRTHRDSPLFALPPPQPRKSQAIARRQSSNETTPNRPSSKPSSQSNGYNEAAAAFASRPFPPTETSSKAAQVRKPSALNQAKYRYHNTAGTGGYGWSSEGIFAGNNGSTMGYSAADPAATTGMRQRKAGAPTQHDADDALQIQAQLLLRQQERQTQHRLAEARQAESALAELGTLFGKMSSLITQQAEVIDRVEDDVEAAMLDVSAGQQEIQTLYSIKKGNRSLILKLFGLLIFFIIFMRLYKN